jgi:hypothetical protein
MQFLCDTAAVAKSFIRGPFDFIPCGFWGPFFSSLHQTLLPKDALFSHSEVRVADRRQDGNNTPLAGRFSEWRKFCFKAMARCH